MAKKIGILGGMSPESTVAYYLHITHTYTQRYGDFGYPEILIYSVSFQPYADWPGQGRWDLIAHGLSEAAKKLEAAGADFILIATNTMHLVYDAVQSSVRVPVLSLLDVVAEAIQAQGSRSVGLLGTRMTMESSLYSKALQSRGIEVLTPDQAGRDYIDHVIYSELVAGQIRPQSRQGVLEIINQLAGQGAQGIILGCTELPLLIHADDTPLPLFDTTSLHAEAALQFALQD
ncbi:MAG: aspartate/glutamate racemase family protein [Chloroflexi bacterium]|jgi:aspartate racemase|nr:aspartate/glutamate racemase family protein [Anaerolineaceae bacterium]NMB89114.1 aspartate/glutamate racemase family protein [Chloroflexota bacterium]